MRSCHPPPQLRSKTVSYQVPNGNRHNTRVPSIDVYLPHEEDASGVAMVIFCGGGYGAVCIGVEGMPMQQFLNDKGIAVFYGQLSL